MAATPKISVIVPFYNLGACESLCVESLVAQEFESCEFVLVDDGSTDRTYSMLKEYEQRDERIRVFRKENGGLSDARNFGVSVSRGDYVSFVDGDDIVSPYYLQALAGALDDECGSPLVIGISDRIPCGQMAEHAFSQPTCAKRVSREWLCEALAYEKVLPSACAHLAPRVIYEECPFPKGRVYEEISTICSFVAKADEIYLISEPIYGYVMRDDSIVHRRNVPSKQIEDYWSAIEDFNSGMSVIASPSNSAMAYFRALHESRILRLLSKNDNRGKSKRKQKAIQRETRANLKLILKDQNVSLGNKARVALLSSSLPLYLFLFNVFDRIR